MKQFIMNFGRWRLVYCRTNIQIYSLMIALFGSLINVELHAQYLGIRFGVYSQGNTNYDSDLPGYSKRSSDIPSVGLTYEQIFTKHSSLEIGVMATEKIFNAPYFGSGDSYSTYSDEVSTSYVNIPVSYIWKINMGSHLRLGFGVGAFADIGIGDGENNGGMLFGAGLKRYGYGVLGKVSLELNNFCLGIEQQNSFSDYSDFGEKLKIVNVSVGYRFGGSSRYYKSKITIY